MLPGLPISGLLKFFAKILPLSSKSHKFDSRTTDAPYNKKQYFSWKARPRLPISVQLTLCVSLEPFPSYSRLLFATYASHVIEMLDDVTDRK
jgi:hypothetical protein